MNDAQIKFLAQEIIKNVPEEKAKQDFLKRFRNDPEKTAREIQTKTAVLAQTYSEQLLDLGKDLIVGQDTDGERLAKRIAEELSDLVGA